MMMPIALADNEFGHVIRGGKLLISKVDAKVDGKSDKNLDFGDRIRREAKPESKVEFTIEFKNNFTSDEDLDIENIDGTVTIEEIDDGDDLDEDINEFDLRADKDKKVTVSFDIPLEVEEDIFNVLINAEGEDQNGTTHEIEFEAELEVQKENNEVRFLRNTLTPSEITCSRTAQLSTAVINTGSDDEDSTVLEITNAELGVNFKETFDLSNDPFDEDSKFTKTFTFTVPANVATGVYTILSKVSFNDGKDTKSEQASLVVGACEALKPAEEKKTEEKKEEEAVVVVQPIQPTTPVITTAVTQPTTPIQPATEEKSLLENNLFIGALITGVLIVILVIVLLLVALMRKRS